MKNDLVLNIFKDLITIAPITIISIVILIAIIFKALMKESDKPIFYLSVVGLLISFFYSLFTFDLAKSTFNDMLLWGKYINYFIFAIVLLSILFLFQSYSFINKFKNYSEFIILSLISILGMMIMCSSIDLITIFLGLELMSLPFYILAGFNRNEIKSNEASLKYFLLGAFATGIFLYGVVLIYGASGTTNLFVLNTMTQQTANIPIFTIGCFLLLIGLSFKIASAPFHMWVPDVYEGTPTLAVSIMSSATKIAAFSVLSVAFSIFHSNYLLQIILILSAASMIVGNIFGLAQKNLKRLFAYSSIAHAGYLLIGIATGNAIGWEGVSFYLISYTFTSLGIFGIILYLESKIENVDYENIAGLSKTEPLISFLLSLFMFSLIGLPPLGGFIGKYYLFLSAINEKIYWIVIIGVLTSVVSLYYYLRIVVQIYFKEPKIELVFEKSKLNMISIIISAIIILVIGLFPSVIMNIFLKLYN